MRIAEVIGTVTLNRCHPSFQGATLKLVVPKSFENLAGQSDKELDTLAAWDDLGAGHNSVISIAEGPEAAQPFRPELKAVDCYVSAILDNVSLDKKAMKQIKPNRKS